MSHNRLFLSGLFLSVIILFSCQKVFSQTKDAGLWTGIRLNYDISEKLNLSFEEEIRFFENFSRLDKYYSEIGLSYEINKNVEIGAFYRYSSIKNPYINYSHYHRFHTEIILKSEFKRYSFSFRSRFQSKYTDPYVSDNGMIPKDYSRNKLAVSYNIRKLPLTPYASYELFYQLNNPDGNVFDKSWMTIGVKYRFKNRDRLSIYYRLSQDHNINNPLNLNILGIGYNIKINNKLKR
ncbi:DUF2490 domain-containing protein [Bacteroidota bacterium]